MNYLGVGQISGRKYLCPERMFGDFLYSWCIYCHGYCQISIMVQNILLKLQTLQDVSDFMSGSFFPIFTVFQVYFV